MLMPAEYDSRLPPFASQAVYSRVQQPLADPLRPCDPDFAAEHFLSLEVLRRAYGK